MALQGDLSSFTLPDVLRLLAGTGKSGSLEVSSPPASGEVWLHEGGVVGGTVSTSPHANRPADVVLELLRFDGGTFVFDDQVEIDDSPAITVTEALDEAEKLLEEWLDVEAVVPSMGAWISLAHEIEGEEVTIDAAGWRMLAVVAAGGSVHDLAAALELTDLDASRQVKALVEAGLTTVRTDLTSDTQMDLIPPASSGAIDQDEEAAHEADLAVLRSDDRTVMMVEDDDALLPEPLPSDSVEYHGDLLGTVDGRTFESMEQDGTPAAPAPPAPAPVAALPEMDDADVDAAFDMVAAHAAEQGEHLPDVLAIHDAPLTEAPAPEPAAPEVEASDAPAEPPAAVATEPAEVDDDRDSLLKFLSTVKP